MAEGGYPAWVTLSAGGENALTNMTAPDLEDLIYLLQWALNRAREVERGHAPVRDRGTVDAAVLAERERCAVIAETFPPRLTETMEMPPSQYDIAELIRSG